MPAQSALITFSGGEVLKKRLAQLGARAMTAAGRAFYREGEQIMARSKQEFVPVQTGALKASGMVRPPEVSGLRVVVTLGYGGAAVNYAVPVHERMGVHHPVGGPKYLERPVLEATRGMGERIAKDLAGELGR